MQLDVCSISVSVHCNQDSVLFQFYGHRQKLKIIGREADLEPMNKKALQIAREVADETGTLMAGNINNSTLYDHNDPATHQEVLEQFKVL